MDSINAIGNPNHVLGTLNDHLLVILNVVFASPTTIDQESEACRLGNATQAIGGV